MSDLDEFVTTVDRVLRRKNVVDPRRTITIEIVDGWRVATIRHPDRPTVVVRTDSRRGSGHRDRDGLDVWPPLPATGAPTIEWLDDLDDE